MKTKYFFLAAIGAMTLASCSNDGFVGEDSQALLGAQGGDGSIQFTYNLPNATRADIGGSEAAAKLGDNFYVTGTKGTEETNSPSTTVVFDNYLVHYGINTAGTTESNTANWEYVGIDQSSATASERLPKNYDRVKLSDIVGPQTIKYWDYSKDQYDFLAFSTGTFKAVSKTNLTGAGDDQIGVDEIGVTAMHTGATLATDAYTLYLPSTDALENTYITDITTVTKSNYGSDVLLKFKNLGSKVRIALYETVPGYSVKDVVFYTVDGTSDFTDTGKDGTARLISADTYGIPVKGTIQVYFPTIGKTNRDKSPKPDNYNKATATVSPVGTVPANYEKVPEFDALTAQLVAKERNEKKETSPGVFAPETGNVFLGRTLPTATFAGSINDQYYQTVFPVSDSDPLTLRVDYTLVPIDGATEVIKVYGAKAVIPSTYTVWQPNYAYTYIFKISDNTNGWTTSTVTTEPAGLFPITFDAVVAQATEATAEQTTITTVATPSITTYQQKHDKSKNEYSKAIGKNIYVQVMENSTTTPSLVTTLSDGNSLLYQVTPSGKTYASQPAGWPTGFYTDAACTTEATGVFSSSTTYYKLATEAEVMDALQKRTVAYSADATTVTGRDGIILTKKTIDNSVKKIENGADDQPIDLGASAGKAAMITITGGSALANGTYAYVYDYTTGDRSSTEITEYQPKAVENGTTVVTGWYHVTSATLGGLGSGAVTGDNEAVNNSYIYFTKTTTDNGATYNYSYFSVAGKTHVPGGLIKYEKSSLTKVTGDGTKAAAGTFYFDTYFYNKGAYAVKVIKVVA